MGRSASPGPPPYGAATTIQNAAPKCNEVQQMARVAPMPRAQIFEVPLDQTYQTYGYRLGMGRQKPRWPDQILPQARRPQTPDQNQCHNPRAPEDMA